MSLINKKYFYVFGTFVIIGLIYLSQMVTKKEEIKNISDSMKSCYKEFKNYNDCVKDTIEIKESTEKIIIGTSLIKKENQYYGYIKNKGKDIFPEIKLYSDEYNYLIFNEKENLYKKKIIKERILEEKGIFYIIKKDIKENHFSITIVGWIVLIFGILIFLSYHFDKEEEKNKLNDRGSNTNNISTSNSRNNIELTRRERMKIQEKERIESGMRTRIPARVIRNNIELYELYQLEEEEISKRRRNGERIPDNDNTRDRYKDIPIREIRNLKDLKKQNNVKDEDFLTTIIEENSIINGIRKIILD